MTDNQEPRVAKERGLARRILFRALWFISIVFIAIVVIRAVVGGIAGMSMGTYEDAFYASQVAVNEFFEQHGVIVVASVFAIASLLVWKANLPGTGRYIDADTQLGSSGPSDRRRLPVWLRTILALIIVVLGAGVWGFLVSIMGAPSVLGTIGALLIGVVVMVKMFGENN